MSTYPAHDTASEDAWLQHLTMPESEAPSGDTPIQSSDEFARSKNVFRPTTFDQVVGQPHIKRLVKRMVEAARLRDEPFSHTLFVGPSGMGKTTLAHVVATELGRRVYQVEAPISYDTLLQLQKVMHDGDILFLDEIHQQAAGDRRGRESSMAPEVLFAVMEDHVLLSQTGVLPFPHITIMGATTDEGQLPDAFINRFPLRPRLEKYTQEDMQGIVERNAASIGIHVTPEAAEMFARASRGVPREVNNFVRNSYALGNYTVTRELASEVVRDLCGMTEDGLTADMQGMLTFLYTRAQRVVKDEVVYQASVNTIATAIGKSRDTKAIQLRVEPWLIEEGFVQVASGGRKLTDKGVLRARRLLQGE